MDKERKECCAGCGSCDGLGRGVYYYGKQLSMRERTEGSCCRTREVVTAFEIQGRGSEAVCDGCVRRRRLLLLLSALPCLGLMAFALAAPGAIPPQGPVRLAFFALMAASLFPVWIFGRRAFFRADWLRDEIAAARAKRRLRGKVAYERVNRAGIDGGPGAGEEWTGTTTLRSYSFFTRREYRRLGGTDRGTP
ncbi:hypothetical protein [Paucidesulfovibrio longus]|uniref:hypothetical protein n=1 Tax=Paucidesulfovibrio longus TaxID=889 RepID=UPI00041BF8B8|nr:hypothetical protein [Paucidesulfovibrio longus]